MKKSKKLSHRATARCSHWSGKTWRKSHLVLGSNCMIDLEGLDYEPRLECGQGHAVAGHAGHADDDRTMP